MKAKLKKLINFDDTRGYISQGLMSETIQIPDKIFRFVFLPRDSSKPKDTLDEEDEDSVSSLQPIFEMAFKVSYRKENYFGDVFYFLELKFLSKREISGQNPRTVLMRQFKDFSQKQSSLMSRGMGDSATIDQFYKMEDYDRKNFKSSKELERSIGESLIMKRRSTLLNQSKARVTNTSCEADAGEEEDID